MPRSIPLYQFWFNRAYFYFNPRSPCGERLRPIPPVCLAFSNFNPRSPCGERLPIGKRLSARLNFNPRSPCGERRSLTSRGLRPLHFNPRSPCGERPVPCRLPIAWVQISIHAPHAGSDLLPSSCMGDTRSFQSTLPMRGATTARATTRQLRQHFNPRSPCGERHRGHPVRRRGIQISIHAPHAGSDLQIRRMLHSPRISIHAPHAGSDVVGL